MKISKAYTVNCKKQPLTAEYLPLTCLIKLRALTNANFKKKTKNELTKQMFSSYFYN